MTLALRIPAISLLVCCLAGCGGAPQGSSDAASQPPTAAAAPGAAAAASAPAGAPADSGTAAAAAQGAPPAIVAQFYDALRKGSDVTIASLLTDKAREETSKSGLGIQSQASQSLTYEIRESEYVGDQMEGAHVRTMWMEPDANGQLVATEVIWVLRKQSNGWKISGMATPVVEGELPLLFNFEEPEDMLQKKAFVEQQLAQPAESQPATAESTGPAGETILR